MRSFRILVAILGFMAALPAHAWVRTAVPNATSAQSTCPDGVIDTYWSERNHKWWLFQDPSHPSTAAGLDWSGVLTAMQASVSEWQSVDCTDLTFEYAGSTSTYTIGYDPDSKDNQNIEIFREAACSDTSVVPANDSCLESNTCGDKYNCWGNSNDIIALTTTTFDQTTGQLFDSDTEFNATPNPSTGRPYYHFTDYANPSCTSDPSAANCLPACSNPTDPTETGCVATDVQNTATHEFGHYLGLAHPPVTYATMYAYAPPGQTSKRNLSMDDTQAICAIYPKGSPTDWCIPPASTTTKSTNNCASSPIDAFGLLSVAWALRRRLHRQKL